MGEIINGKEVYCPYCNKVFYVRGFKLCYAKTITCFFCGKRIKNLTKEEIKKLQKLVGEDL